MDARSILAKLRAGDRPNADEITWFASGLASGAVTDAQAGAFAMGVCKSGLGEAGRVALTTAMRDSGDVLAWDVDGPVLDKHSTGGVGDCVSLLLAPALAACGANVPMISGRGLGHTGGTLDKLEAISGVKTEVSADHFRSMTRDIGCAIVSATGDVAPADKRLYQVRDVTSTVDSIDLITASILSKKLAAGLDGLILDVKTGSGAILQAEGEARDLARSLVATANGTGCKTMALLTNMDQPLATSMGNALEVKTVLKAFKGAEPDLVSVTSALGGALLHLGGLAESVQAGSTRIEQAVTTGAAAEVFDKMLRGMGAAADWSTSLPKADIVVDVTADRDGFLAALDGRSLGHLVVDLGGGRNVETDKIDPRVGLSDIVRLGAKVSKGDLLCRLHLADTSFTAVATQRVRDTVTITDQPPKLRGLILEQVT